MSEKVGPFDEPVEEGDRVWVRHNSRIWDGVLLRRSPADYEYEVRVRVGDDQHVVHRYNVQPQKEAQP